MKYPMLCRAALMLALTSTLAGTAIVAQAEDTQASATQATPAMKMAADPGTAAAQSPSTAAFEQGMASMMHGMHAPYTGDPDADFVSHMIPHHEGAVSMAQVERMYGKDPDMRKLALDIIKAQEKEIALMKRWQAKHAAK